MGERELESQEGLQIMGRETSGGGGVGGRRAEPARALAAGELISDFIPVLADSRLLRKLSDPSLLDFS